MSFEALALHDAIGWDFDGTLFGHPKSGAMHAFILAHPRKRHVIVTYRSHALLRMLWPDLALYPDAPPPPAFAGVLPISEEFYEAHKPSVSPQGTLVHTGEWMAWKGRVCRDHGLTALVDDAPDQVRDSCLAHGIAYFHPDAL